jgi:hypothetical protein
MEGGGQRGVGEAHDHGPAGNDVIDVVAPRLGHLFQQCLDGFQGAVPEVAMLATAMRMLASVSKTEAPARPAGVLAQVLERYWKTPESVPPFRLAPHCQPDSQ